MSLNNVTTEWVLFLKKEWDKAYKAEEIFWFHKSRNTCLDNCKRVILEPLGSLVKIEFHYFKFDIF